MASLTVREISRDEHLAFVTARSRETSVSFLQCPSWAAVKSEWGAQSLGWYDAHGTLVGAGLVLLRQVPRVKRFLAYLPEGPVIDWTGAGGDLRDWLVPMTEHLKTAGAFGIKMGPLVARRRWSAATVKAAVADGSAKRLGDVPPDGEDPTAADVAATLNGLDLLPNLYLRGCPLGCLLCDGFRRRHDRRTALGTEVCPL